MSYITTDIDLVIQTLGQSKPVAIPTETVYGLAALIDHPEAISKVFSLKNRPLNHPLIVHVAQNWDLTDLVEDIPDYAKVLMKTFWPGPLTLVLPSKKNSLNPLVNAGQSTVAIRCPQHPQSQRLLQALNQALVAPSANPFGKISPTTAFHVQQSFEKEDLLILDGGRCQVGIESTIIDASQPDTYQILRHGMIDEQAIAALCGLKAPSKPSKIRVPGQIKHHYQPQKPLYYFEHFESLSNFIKNKAEISYLIAKKRPDFIPQANFYPFANQPQEAAFDLFFQLRKADESTAAYLFIELPPNTSAWAGIRERILKAGQSLEHKND